MIKQTEFGWRDALRIGFIGGVVALFFSLVGMVEAFGERDIIGGVISLGQILPIVAALGAGFYAAQRTARERRLRAVLHGLLAGLVTGIMLAVLVLLGSTINLRAVLINASPTLFKLLTLDRGTGGVPFLVIGGLLLGGLGGAIQLLPRNLRRALIIGLVWVLLLGLLQELLRVILGRKGVAGAVAELLFARKGLTVPGAVIVFLVAAGFSLLRAWKGQALQREIEQLPPAGQRAVRVGGAGLVVLVVLSLPVLLGSYPSEVLANVGLYILMGFGLNIVVGFAGLLDLGYVAFFAIGAYTMGVLTTTGELGGLQLSFWEALPITIAVSVLAGILLGIPVLRMRGDYLAIVTLGFGEIIRILALSDFLRPFIGGAQGILAIPKAYVGNIELAGPQHIYYLIVGGCALAAFVSWRLRDSRLGRAWKAMREDEDVAAAMGINLIQTKLLAFAIGAAFSGLSGAIFASKLGSIFPHSFSLLISINVLSLIIVGGIGSLPGVVVGALILVGLPELLREFAEYRLMMYGALLVIMMLVKPEGFWPEATRQRELAGAREEIEVAEAAPALAGGEASG
jgi:branched-chain amino acid transport system permease protein